MTESEQKLEPTNQLRWFRVEENDYKGVKPLTQIANYQWSEHQPEPDWYCLKQLWSDGEWRDIEAIL